MRLLQKNTKYLLKVLPLVLLACTILFFILLKIQTQHLQEVQLLLKQENVLRKFNTGELQSSESIIGEYEISAGKYIPPGAYKRPTDTLIYYASRNEYVPFQMRAVDVTRNNKVFQLTTFVSSVEISHLMVAVLGSQILIYLILFYSIFRINTRLSKTLWHPFYETMDRLKEYDINVHHALQLDQKTGISEFNELNSVIHELSERNHQAYVNQKQFVENASHEIQTPLAIIRSKVELLMEQSDITQDTAALILEIADANNRLSNLNTTLILLSKIQNHQFLTTEIVDLSLLIRITLQNFSQYYLEAMPAVKSDIKENVTVKANKELMDILVSNLVKNAIVHNIPGGYISISLSKNKLKIENSGLPLKDAPEAMFERFRTADGNKRTTGLGLALVRQITEYHGYQISYNYKGETHTLSIEFSP